MSKSKVVDHLREKMGITKADAKEALDIVLEGIAKTVNEEGTLILPNFGTFKKIHKAAREGRNPSNGEKILIPAKTVTKFRPSF